MLVLSRAYNDGIVILTPDGYQVRVIVADLNLVPAHEYKGETVREHIELRLGIEAEDCEIVREELLQRPRINTYKASLGRFNTTEINYG